MHALTLDASLWVLGDATVGPLREFGVMVRPHGNQLGDVLSTHAPVFGPGDQAGSTNK